MFKVIEAIFGTIFFGAAIGTWYYFKIDPIIAIIIGAFGLRMAGDAFNYYFFVMTVGLRIYVPESEIVEEIPVPTAADIPTIEPPIPTV